MIRGFFSRRSSQRIPFQVEIGIQFSFKDKEPVIASTTNLSAEGVRFFLPKGTIKFAPEEIIELVFHLPNRGDITVQGEICYFSNAVDGDLKPVVYYGVKFINVTPEDEEAIQTFCQSQLIDETEPEMETAATLSMEEIKLEEEISTGANLEPEKSASTIPTFSNNQNAFHSLSQEIIDQIVQSMQSAQPAHPFEPTNQAVSNEPPAPAAATESAAVRKAVPASPQNEAIVERIRQLAESINFKFDKELFDTSSKSVEILSSSVAAAEPVATPKQDNTDHSTPDNFLNFLSQPVGQNEPENENPAPDETADSVMATSFFKSSSQASLIDVLYGNEPSNQTEKTNPANHKDDIPAIPKPNQASTAVPMGEEYGLNPEKSNFFNNANNKSSSVSMDQRMIDQIIQSLTKK